MFIGRIFSDTIACPQDDCLFSFVNMFGSSVSLFEFHILQHIFCLTLCALLVDATESDVVYFLCQETLARESFPDIRLGRTAVAAMTLLLAPICKQLQRRGVCHIPFSIFETRISGSSFVPWFLFFHLYVVWVCVPLVWNRSSCS